MKTFRQLNEEINESRTLEGVEIRTEKTGGYSPIHHVYVHGKHTHSIMDNSVGKDKGYLVYKPNHDTSMKMGDRWKDSHDGHNWGHPLHRTPREKTVDTGKRNILGMHKHQKITAMGPKRYASLHQAVRSAVSKYHEHGE